MDENPNQNNEEDLSTRLRETRHLLKELRNSGAQIQLTSSSQLNLKEQLEVITSTTEQPTRYC
ncbi:hypothetical protein [uncultured Bifidobacterium sp.]|uniref:hypothetical protein n=1 Tax=uncultured Bifidobacterium sp. TaxID=165187 RepID=UPI0025967206|nr:hypothetical protein [uncultured Bifidobacterium sp.]